MKWFEVTYGVDSIFSSFIVEAVSFESFKIWIESKYPNIVIAGILESEKPLNPKPSQSFYSI